MRPIRRGGGRHWSQHPTTPTAQEPDRHDLPQLTALTATAAVALAAAAPATSHATATSPGRHTVTQTVYVKKQPGRIFDGTMFRGQTFRVERLSPSGKYAYGMAYGHVNRHAWIEASALTRRR